MICESWLVPVTVFSLIALSFAGVILIGKTPFLFARKYIFSPKKKNVINLITMISVIGISLVTAALVIILSIFNGFHALIGDMFSRFDADLKVQPKIGRVFHNPDSLLSVVYKMEGVEFASPIIENKALIKYFDRQHIATIRGMKDERKKISPVEKLVYEGDFDLSYDGLYPNAVIGSGVASTISASLNDLIHPIEIYAVSGETDLFQDPESALNKINVFPSGYFSIQMEYDNKFVLVDYTVAENLFKLKGQATSLELKVKEGYSQEKVKADLVKQLGPSFEIFTGYEQHKTLFDVMQNEKFLGYLVVSLVLLLAGVNIVGSLSMTVLEKSRDIGVLRAVGTTRATISNIFLGIGYLIGMISAGLGALLGMGIGWLQQTFGFVKLSGGESFLIDAYPLKLCPWDFLLVFFTVLFLSLFAAWFPARKASRLLIVESMKR